MTPAVRLLAADTKLTTGAGSPSSLMVRVYVVWVPRLLLVGLARVRMTVSAASEMASCNTGIGMSTVRLPAGMVAVPAARL